MQLRLVKIDNGKLVEIDYGEIFPNSVQYTSAVSQHGLRLQPCMVLNKAKLKNIVQLSQIWPPLFTLLQLSMQNFTLNLKF